MAFERIFLDLCIARWHRDYSQERINKNTIDFALGLRTREDILVYFEVITEYARGELERDFASLGEKGLEELAEKRVYQAIGKVLNQCCEISAYAWEELHEQERWVKALPALDCYLLRPGMMN